MPKRKSQDSSESVDDVDFAISVPAGSDGTVTARKAGGIADLELSISPAELGEKKAMQNLNKAVNLALKSDFIETDLDEIYKGARIYDGAVRIMHVDYIGLGDGIFANVGKTARSFSLTFKGPDAGSPEGKELIEENGGGAISGVLNLLGRKLNFLQEFEDKVPMYTEQMLDRLEAKRVITDWNRDEWEIGTTFIGLDIILTPRVANEEDE